MCKNTKKSTKRRTRASTSQRTRYSSRLAAKKAKDNAPDPARSSSRSHSRCRKKPPPSSLPAPRLAQPFPTSITALCASNLPWGEKHKSLWVATSFLAYLPLIAITYRLSGSSILSSWWAAQIMFGVGSDYFTAGTPSLFHLVDRIMATLSVAGMFSYVAFTLGIMQAGFLVCIPLRIWDIAQTARRANNAKKYSLYHGWWHLAGSAVSCYAMLKS